MGNQKVSGDDRKIQQSFLRTLVEDVQAAVRRSQRSDTARHRREAVRTIFAAIEGISWTCREFVRESAKSLDALDPTLEMALREQTYFVSERGKVSTQTRFISFTAMFKLISRIAEEIATSLHVDFSERGWQGILHSLDTRNRLMHPKSFSDLAVSLDDVQQADLAFRWMLQTSLRMMESVQAEMKLYNQTARELVDALTRGDPLVVAEYEAIMRIIERDGGEV